MVINIYEFQKELFQKGNQNGFSDMEMFYASSKSTSANAQRSVAKDQSIVEICAASFRGLIKDKMGYSYAEKINEESVDFLLKEAKENAEVIESYEEEELFKDAKKYENVNEFSEELAKVPVQKLIESAMELEKAALNADSRIEQVLECNISKSIQEVAIINTKGLNCYSKICSVNAAVYVMASDGKQTSTGFCFDFTLKDFSKLDFKNIARKAAEDAVSKFVAETVQSRFQK